MRSEALAAHFREAFAADWRGGSGGGTTWLVIAGALAALVLAVVVARKTIRFGG